MDPTQATELIDAPPLLELRGVSKRFGSKQAVEGVSLTVVRNEVVALLGPNGAGKSTTLRIAAGLVRPDAGDVLVGGHDLRTARLRALRSVGFLIEGPSLPGELTARAALRYVGLLADSVDPADIDRSLASVGLSPLASQRVRSLSMGERQRLGIAAALIGRPPLLVLDEPTNGLDPAGIREMGELCRGLARSGVGVLVSSHLLDEVERMADRAVVMVGGRVTAVERVGGGGALAKLFFSVAGDGRAAEGAA